MSTYTRPQAAILAARLQERRRFLQVVTGPRQVGKTTLVEQVVRKASVPVHTASADEPSLKADGWLAQQWEIGRIRARDGGKDGAILVIDEIQKVPGWAEGVKRLWDEDTRARRTLRVILLGSAPVLIGHGITESLAGRFETVHLPHWSYAEMRQAFRFTLDQYVFHGGYPGAAPLIRDVERWRSYLLQSLIETTISRDVLLLSRVDKPALLRRLFQLGATYSGQILSYTKMLGQLQDAGNTTTLAHYLDLLSGAGMISGLQKYAAQDVRRRGSIPKLQVHNQALMSATSGLTLSEAREDPEYWGRLVESTVGAHLVNAASTGACEVFYWRERDAEVDFVVRLGRRLLAVEVKSSKARERPAGLAAFADAFAGARPLLVGGDGVELGEFLSRPVESWFADVNPRGAGSKRRR